jgi:hypothetical protein
METRNYTIGAPVIFIDEHFEEHHAVVTRWWGLDDEGKRLPGVPEGTELGCNLLFVSGDATKTDPYGRQVERRTSVCHTSVNPARANCWHWPSE